jgi:hypothetical protein
MPIAQFIRIDWFGVGVDETNPETPCQINLAERDQTHPGEPNKRLSGCRR